MRLLGNQIASQIKKGLIRRPNLTAFFVVVQVGQDPVSNLYVKKKVEFAKDIGVPIEVKKTSKDKIEKDLRSLSKDDRVKGIIVQLPLPEGLDREKVLGIIPKEKDVDGFNYILNRPFKSYPPTILAISKIMTDYNLPVKEGVLIIGGGFLVGSPLRKFLNEKGIKAKILTKDDPDYDKKIKNSDVVVVATGGGRYFGQKDFKQGAFVIDASTVADEGKTRGDVNPEGELINLAPVPRGVGPVTVAMLFKNLYDL